MDGDGVISNIDDIEKMIMEIDKVLDRTVDIYIIGGGAMMYLNTKKSTKDIDLVVSTREEYEALTLALKTIGFKSDRPTPGMERTTLSDMLSRGDFRIDVFEKKICGMLQLSENMKKRSSLRLSLENTRFFSCTYEDIFLLKSVTEREHDLEDSNNLIVNHLFDWNILISEIKNQMKNGNAQWITFTTERMVIIFGDEAEEVQPFIELEKEFLEAWAESIEQGRI
ncbi:MAG: hypothetical protein IKP04_07000 [Candidatus Methanomethylophilaceae archaeon]|nr:hypothetical protein [Candidatus Methanomethylophilaceae archaeon]